MTKRSGVLGDLACPLWPAWLLTDDQATARHEFALDVVLADLEPQAKLDCCAAYEDRWRRDGLAAALRCADRLAPLGPGMTRLLQRLTLELRA